MPLLLLSFCRLGADKWPSKPVPFCCFLNSLLFWLVFVFGLGLPELELTSFLVVAFLN
jgi:hypothetical protein